MTYKNARGVIPWKPGDELPEDAIDCVGRHEKNKNVWQIWTRGSCSRQTNKFYLSKFW